MPTLRYSPHGAAGWGKAPKSSCQSMPYGESSMTERMDDTAEAGGDSPSWREAVGYLKGRGGVATSTAAEAMGDWREVFAEIRAELDELEADAIALEAGMEAVGATLYRSQPPMYKRVAVRWWRLSGGRRRVPVLVRIEGGAGGRVKLEPVERGIRLRKDRGFGLCADLAKQAVDRYWALLAVRKELLTQVAEVGRVVGRAKARRRKVIDQAQAEMAEARREAEERLRMVGYDVPEAEESQSA